VRDGNLGDKAPFGVENVPVKFFFHPSLFIRPHQEPALVSQDEIAVRRENLRELDHVFDIDAGDVWDQLQPLVFVLFGDGDGIVIPPDRLDELTFQGENLDLIASLAAEIQSALAVQLIDQGHRRERIELTLQGNRELDGRQLNLRIEVLVVRLDVPEQLAGIAQAHGTSDDQAPSVHLDPGESKGFRCGDMPQKLSVEGEYGQTLVEDVLNEDFILRRDDETHRLVQFPRPLAFPAESPEELAPDVEDFDPVVFHVENIRRPIFKDIQGHDLDERFFGRIPAADGVDLFEDELGRRALRWVGLPAVRDDRDLFLGPNLKLAGLDKGEDDDRHRD